jgi:hypothetical protein
MEFLTYHEILNFITVSTRVRIWSLSRARQIQPATSNPTFSRSNLILSSYLRRLPTRLFASDTFICFIEFIPCNANNQFSTLNQKYLIKLTNYEARHPGFPSLLLLPPRYNYTTSIYISLMKHQFFSTHWYTIWQETEKTWPIFNKPTFKHVMFYENIGTNSFLWIQHFDEVELVTQLSSNAGISLWRIVWVTTNCRFMSDILVCAHACVKENVSCLSSRCVFKVIQDKAARSIGADVTYLKFSHTRKKPKGISIQFSIGDLFQKSSGGFSGDSLPPSETSTSH